MEAPPAPPILSPTSAGAVDARAIVPVSDVHGGVTIYDRDRPTHYLLEGEWFLAEPMPTAPGRRRADDNVAPPTRVGRTILTGVD